MNDVRASDARASDAVTKRERGSIYLVRHGETEWSRSGRHTGRSDIPLTEAGRERAASLAPRFAGLRPALVLCSPLSRAQETARLAGLVPDDLDPDLLEWDYGAWEGLTTAEIRERLDDPDWTVWANPIPAGSSDATPGEQPEDVAVRVERVIRRCLPLVERGEDCALVAHGHVLRMLTAQWLALPARDGRLWALDAGAVSILGFEREQHVIEAWNT